MKMSINPMVFLKAKFKFIMLFSFLSAGVFAQPALSSFSPDSGSVGTLVTINGTGFNPLDSVYIGGVKALITSSTSTQIIGLVMPGATNAPVSVFNNTGSAVSTSPFIVNPTVFPSKFEGFMANSPFMTQFSSKGVSIALSNDGKTALMGAPDNSPNGAWVTVMTETGWKAQDKFLHGFGANSRQGTAVALSADGNTAIISGENDSIQTWIFTRTDTIWTEQASLLNLTGLAGSSFHSSLALSADGNTAAMGVYSNLGNGGIYVLKRSGNIWSQLGSLLTVSDTIGATNFGQAVDISADGKTILASGPQNDGYAGALWFFVDSSGTFVQQGSKLTANGAIGNAHLGESVALSADGNTAIAGGRYDNNQQGAIWVFTRNNGIWSNGTKIAFAGSKQLGRGVALTADGSSIFTNGCAQNEIVTLYSFIKNGLGWSAPTAQISLSTFKNFGTAPAGIAVSADGSIGITGEPGSTYGSGGVYYFKSNPVITVSVSQIGPLLFYTCSGTPSIPKSFYVNGYALPNLIISGPQLIEFSTGVNGMYSNPLQLYPINGTIDSTLIFVRIVGSAIGNNSLNGLINFSAGHYVKSIPVSGSTLATPKNNIISGSSIYYIGDSLPIITGSTPTEGNTNGQFKYLWLESNLGTLGSYVPASGENTSKDYSPPFLTTKTWYKRIVISADCKDTSDFLAITPTIKQVGISTYEINPILIYPNPASSLIYLENLGNHPSTIYISNSLGQQIGSNQNASNNTTLDISQLTNGIYILTIENEFGFQRIKFIKQ